MENGHEPEGKRRPMIRYFTNRELAERFDIKLARWKRWSREFLPADPLGGMQSGYARQYSPDDAFNLYLAGHLVSGLKFSIPAARKILQDLDEPLSNLGFRHRIGHGNGEDGEKKTDRMCHIVYILASGAEDRTAPAGVHGNLEFQYIVRSIVSEPDAGGESDGLRTETFSETVLPGNQAPNLLLKDAEVAAVVNLSVLLSHFVDLLDLPGSAYGAMRPS